MGMHGQESRGWAEGAVVPAWLTQNLSSTEWNWARGVTDFQLGGKRKNSAVLYSQGQEGCWVGAKGESLLELLLLLQQQDDDGATIRTGDHRSGLSCWGPWEATAGCGSVKFARRAARAVARPLEVCPRCEWGRRESLKPGSSSLVPPRRHGPMLSSSRRG